MSELAIEQGVAVVAFDVKQRLPKNCLPVIDLLMDWFGQTEYQKAVYEEHQKRIGELAELLQVMGCR